MSESAGTVLIVEDEMQMRRFLRTALAVRGYSTIEAENGREGLIAMTGRNPDIVLLDLGLPDEDGLEIIRRIREWSRVPIVVVSARRRENDKVAALDAGADDYLTKPFGVDELLARIRVALRHAAELGAGDASGVIEVQDLRIDLARHEVTVQSRAVHLTPIEFRLLALLARNAGKVLTHRQILKEVWGPTFTHQTHYLRVFMTQMRRKIEADPARPRLLLTEPGVGYRLKDG